MFWQGRAKVLAGLAGCAGGMAGVCQSFGRIIYSNEINRAFCNAGQSISEFHTSLISISENAFFFKIVTLAKAVVEHYDKYTSFTFLSLLS